MKKYLLVFSALIISFTSNAQVATNFTANDCNGTSHELFAELNAGKVVVMSWVMPCGSCSAPSLTAYNVVQSFATSHPGKVLFYVADDYGATSCAALTNWSNTEIASGLTIFSDASISMADYGTAGMPKVVVMGGYNHSVYFNKNNSAANDAVGIESAINAALSDILDVPAVAAIENAKWTWDANNKSGKFYFTTTSSGNVKYTVYNLLGQAVTQTESRMLSSGNQVLDVATKQIPTGTYFLRLNFNGAINTYKITIQ